MEVYCSSFPLVGRLVGASCPFHEGGPEEDCRSKLSFPFWTGDHHTRNRGLCEFPTTDFCVRRGGWEEPINTCPFFSGSWQRFYSASSQPSPISFGLEMGHKYEIRKAAVDKFWEIWSDKYIWNLLPWRGGEGKCSLQEGSLVLVQDVRLPRMRWPLGVVTRLLPGRDGVIRTVEVRTCNGALVRSVPRLHDLGIMSSGFSDQRDLEPSPQDPDKISEQDNRGSDSSVDNVPPVYITR